MTKYQQDQARLKSLKATVSGLERENRWLWRAVWGMSGVIGVGLVVVLRCEVAL